MGQDNGEAMAHVGVCLTAQLGDGFWALALHFIVEDGIRLHNADQVLGERVGSSWSGPTPLKAGSSAKRVRGRRL